MLQALLAGALLGLTSLPHCAAMCGPLAAFACARSARRDSALRYQLGRSVSYALAGALSGHLGRTLQAFAASRLSALLFALLAAGACLLVARNLWRAPGSATALVQLGRQPAKRPLLATLIRLAPRDPAALGLLSALLPCGALAAALLLAVASADARLGASALLGFATASGLALVVAGALARVLPMHASPALRRGAALVLVAAALFLVVRPSSERPPAAELGAAAVFPCH